MVYCQNCGSMIDEYDSGYYARSMNCIPCYNRKQTEVSARSCTRCGRSIRTDEAKNYKGSLLCTYCFSEMQRIEHIVRCNLCKKEIGEWEEKFKMPNGDLICKKCNEEHTGKFAPKVCSVCKKPSALKFLDGNGNALCMECAQNSPSARAQMRAESTPKISSIFSRIRRLLP